MIRLKGRTTLTVFLVFIFLFILIVYYVLNSEVDKSSAAKIRLHSKLENNYDDILETENHWNKKVKIKASFPESLFQGHKIIHLDLKGAPPVLNYYKYLFPLFKKLGATGVLMEYEDMFPFRGSLNDISADFAYSIDEVMEIQEIAKENDLIIIPLVQTFGHLEFILKLDKYKNYREVYRYPQVLCPTYNKTLKLIYEMIDQVVMMHPYLKYLHIGADEVYQLGECSRCLETLMKNQWNKKQLFLHHVLTVATYIRNKYPYLTVLMWDDEFRGISAKEIINKGLDKLVEPVIWKYTPDPASTLTNKLWDKYSSVWKSVWAATAFKGATSPDSYYTDITFHLENHLRWLEIITKQSKRINFQGIFLTGWQRYDHFSVLCELLATGIPSLAVNLFALQTDDFNKFPIEVPKKVMNALECSGFEISLNLAEPQSAWTKCNYFGVSIYSITLRLYNLIREISKMEEDNTFKGWMTAYNIKYQFSNPSHIEKAVTNLDKYKMEINNIEKDMKKAMEGIYLNYTSQEWLETNLYPLNDKIMALWKAKEKMLNRISWPKRPLIKSPD